MGKTVTSKRPKKLKKELLVEHIPFQSEEFKDPAIVVDLLLECIKEGDLDSFRDVLFVHIMTVNKVELAKKAKIGRRTLYDLIDPKKEFNPELSTVCAIIQAIAA